MNLKRILLSLRGQEVKKYLRIMKLTWFLILALTLQTNANLWSQTTQMDVEVNNQTLLELFSQIEKNSEYRFFYSNDEIDVTQRITVKANEKAIGEILTEAFNELPYSFKELRNNMILVEVRDEVIKSKLPQNLISGKVTDENGDPLPGVTVLIKGTTQGTVTNIEGGYVIHNVSDGATLQFSFVGMLTQEIKVDNQTEINVIMAMDAIGIEEVVAIGFGERKKKDLTGSVSSINSDDLQKAKSLSPQFALQGNTSGVRIVNSSGDPNESPEIYIRGVGTWNGDAQPLYVIDGQIIEPARAGNEDVIAGFGLSTPPNLFNLINPTDIESISVLKDASSAAIYGNRGANGVILITTKKGKKGGAKLEFNSSFSMRNIQTFDMLNTQQYVDITNEMFTNNLNPDVSIENQLYGGDQDSDVNRLVNRSPQFNPSSPFYINDRTTYNWQDEIIKNNAFSQTYDMKVSGATENMDYFLSGSYLDQEDLFQGNDLKRYTASLNVNSKVSNWLKVGINYKYTRQVSNLSMDRNLADVADVAPWQPLYNANNEFGYQPVLDPYYGGADTWHRAKIYGQGSNENFLATSDINYGEFAISRNIGQAYFEIYPLKGLTLRGSLNLDYAQQDRMQLDVFSEANIFKPDEDDPKLEAPDAPGSLGSLGHRVNKILNYQSDFTATYIKSINEVHNINITAAIQDQRHEKEWADYNSKNLITITDNPKRVGYGADNANNGSIYSWSQRYWFGMVGRLSYNYDSKYYVDLSARRDASMGFDDDYRWGNFYSLSGSWRISSEEFMQDLIFIDDLKIRGGWGEAGNDQAVVGSYAYLSGVNTGISSVRFGSGEGDPIGSQILGAVVADLPNPQLTWEVVTTTYVGFDALLLNNRLNATFEWYNRKTDGILMNVVLPTSSGLNNPVDNIGELVNKGVDIQLGWNDRIGDFTYGISGNISFLNNEVTKVFEGRPIDSPDFGRVEEGRSLGLIWGYQVGGIFQSQSEIDAYYASTPDDQISNIDYVAPGDMYFLDVYGNPTDEEPFYSKSPDGKINSYDQTEIGNTIPGYNYGLNLNLGWKGFDLFAGFYGEGDVDKYNTARARFESMSSPGANYTTTTLDRWTPQNMSATMPRAVYGDPAGNNRYSSRYVESAAFFRLNNWQLGYTIPRLLVEKLQISSLRLYVGGQNNIYMKNWSTIDPVNDNYPLPKTLTFGINAKF